MRRSKRKQREAAALVWVGFGASLYVIDVALLLTGKKTLTEVFHDAMQHPVGKWALILGWGFTTKHLFARDVLPWLDPYGAIAGGAMVIQKSSAKIGERRGSRYRVAEPIGIDNSAIRSSDYH